MSNDILITYKFPDGTPTDPLPHQQEFHLYTGWSKHHLLAGSLGTERPRLCAGSDPTECSV